MKLTESLINALEVDIRLGLIDTELREEHGIAEHIWRHWKRRGEEDRNKGLKTLYTMLLDKLEEGREGVVKQTENTVVKMALGEWMFVSITRSINKSGEIIRTVIRTTIRGPSLKAVKLGLSNLDPERWGKRKKPEITSIGAIIPDLYHWKWRGEEDRNKGLKTLHAMLFDRLWEGRKEVVKQLEDILIEMALGKGVSVTTTTCINKLEETIREFERTASRKPNLKASLLWLSKDDPERWSEHKKPGISSIGAIIPDFGKMTEEEWLQQYGNKQPKQKGKS